MKCDRCEFPIPEGAPVYRRRDANQRGARWIWCAKCAAEESAKKERSRRHALLINPAAFEDEKWDNLCFSFGWRPAAPCAACGRPVINDRLSAKICKRVVCGDECRRALYAAQARERRKLPTRACSVCGKDFEPKRTDARYCSAACKQRAHRARQEAKV